MNSFLEVEQTGPLNLILIIAGASLCLASHLFRLLTHMYSYKKDAELFDLRWLLIVTFLGYLGWGYWSAADPVKMNIPSAVSLPAGVSLAVVGMAVFLYSELRKHGVGDRDTLVTTGIYAKIRHPMYIGLVLLHLGYPLIFKSFTACLSTLLWALIIAAWTHFEEKNLERRFGQRYVRYKRQTWF
ncbi:MAG: isoprenylcysteine carboxylmethyltransferase family protein [Spirochaetales bacterium]|nr:isoprenylcysteine carboxylmethyltransferase family protein [Spirochaetales bacterium]